MRWISTICPRATGSRPMADIKMCARENVGPSPKRRKRRERFAGRRGAVKRDRLAWMYLGPLTCLWGAAGLRSLHQFPVYLAFLKATMPLSPGTRLGHYDVTALLGEGGMGQVWQATDTQLNRQVALKILPDAFSADPDRLARFQREAQILASLNHPNIAAIHGIEEAEGTRALVLELVLVEGLTLAARIAKGPIPLDEALPIAKQIAEALEAAHEAGVIHRDLKPANIKVREDGTVKVLDFGLAKALAGGAQGADLSQSPTVTAAGTREGVILGTAAYMSPEQARGKPLDKRTDIWSFGCVLFEILSGRSAFARATLSDTIAAVMSGEPDSSQLPATVPSTIRKLLRRCLSKTPRERVHDAADVRLELAESIDPPAEATDGVVPAAPRLSVATALLACGLLLGTATVTGLVVWTLMSAPEPQVMRFAVSATPAADFAPESSIVAIGNGVVISPDGQRIVYRTPADGLHVRALDQVQSVPLEGAEQAHYPFMSPDGAWVGFTSGDRLQKVSILGGPPITVLELPTNRPPQASWSPDDTIVYALRGRLWRVSASGTSGSEPEQLTSGPGHSWPDVLPGGEAVLFEMNPGVGRSNGRIALLDLASREETIILDEGRFPRYSPTGHILYTAEGTLRAVGFDLDTRRVTSSAIPVLDEVATFRFGAAAFDLSDTGTLVYATGAGESSDFVPVWLDRQGNEEVVPAEPRRYVPDPRLSPDGRYAALTIRDPTAELYIYDFERDSLSRLTSHPAADVYRRRCLRSGRPTAGVSCSRRDEASPARGYSRSQLTALSQSCTCRS